MNRKTILALACSIFSSVCLAAEKTPAQKTAEWETYINAYQPDYSDSSKYLLPPETNRLEKPFPVVRGGRAAATINYSSEDGSAVKTAALELQEFIRRITGVTLPLRDSIDPRGETQIVVGKRTRDIAYGRKLFGEELRKLSGTDGYAVKNIGNRLYVFGETDKGTMNGVYALLENNTDLIFARPHKEFGTVFTQKKDLDFVWGGDVLEIPDSRARGWNGYQDLEWMARNKCSIFNGGGGGDISWMNAKKKNYGIFRQRHCYGHNIGHFIHSRQYFKEHPEYFSLVNGVRKPWRQYCFSNPEMRRVFAENALDMIRRAPEDVRILTVDMDDTWDACECEKCLAPVKTPDGVTVTKEDPAFRSTQYFLFLNEVMRKINAEFPDWKIKTLAYFSTAVPPKCEVNANIIPEFAPYVRSNDKVPLFAPENVKWLEYLKEWAGKSKDIEVYDYHGLGLGFPRPLAEVRAKDFAEMHRYTQGMSSEYTHSGDRDSKGGSSKIWDYSAMEFWVLTRLCWNPAQDVEQLRKYFIRRTFREAAPQVEKFYGTIRSEWFRNKRASTIGDNPVELTKIILLEPGHENTLRAYLEDAAKQVRHPASAEMVKRLRARFEEQVAAAKAIKTPEIALPLLRPQGNVDFANPVWKGAAKIEAFKKCYAKQETPAENPSEVRLFHDSDNLYFYMTFHDAKIADIKRQNPPQGREKDFIPEADHIEIFLCDPLKDGIYYVFTADPFGTTAELQQYDYKWNGEWSVRCRTLKDRWEVIAKIPLKTINADNPKGNLLKGLILRERHAHGADKQREYSSWGGGNHHQTTTFGTLRLMR